MTIGRPRQALSIKWHEITQRLGYNTEKEMIIDILNNSRSILEAAQKIGVSSTTLAYRSDMHGLPKRKQGGLHPKKLGAYRKKGLIIKSENWNKTCLKCGKIKINQIGKWICSTCATENYDKFKGFTDEALYI